MDKPVPVQRLCAWWTRIRQSPGVRAAMDRYREDHDSCEYCGGRKRLAVHHILPVHVRPDLAGDEGNFATLCFRCHLSVGHLNDFARGYVANLREVLNARWAGQL